MNNYQLFIAVAALLVSLNGLAEAVSTKGSPVSPMPANCKNVSGHTYGDTHIENLAFPQLNGTELLTCSDEKSKKTYFRLRLKILLKKAEGVFESQVADELILPHRQNINLRMLSVADVVECASPDFPISPSELGPYALGSWVQQKDESLRLEQVIAAWKIDVPSKTLKFISTKKLRCVSPSG